MTLHTLTGTTEQCYSIELQCRHVMCTLPYHDFVIKCAFSMNLLIIYYNSYWRGIDSKGKGLETHYVIRNNPDCSASITGPPLQCKSKPHGIIMRVSQAGALSMSKLILWTV